MTFNYLINYYIYQILLNNNVKNIQYKNVNYVQPTTYTKNVKKKPNVKKYLKMY